MSYQVRVEASETDRQGALEVRRVVFIEEQGVPADVEMDDLDERAVHLVAVAANGVVGTARVIQLEDGWHIGRVAVMAGWRKHGVGSALMRMAARCAREQGAREIIIHSQATAIPFYTGLGYVAEGPEFLEAGIPHRRMRLRV